MIRIGQLKLTPDHSEQDLLYKIANILRVSENEIQKYQIKKKSVDARKRPQIFISQLRLRVNLISIMHSTFLLALRFITKVL